MRYHQNTKKKCQIVDFFLIQEKINFIDLNSVRLEISYQKALCFADINTFDVLLVRHNNHNDLRISNIYIIYKNLVESCIFWIFKQPIKNKIIRGSNVKKRSY